MPMRLLLAFIIATALCLNAGQSIVTSASNYVTNFSIPSFSPAHTSPIQVEFEIHDWATSPGGFVFASHAAGSYCQFIPSGYLYCTSYWDTSGFAYAIPLPATKILYVRLMRDPAGLTQSVEAWGYQGNLIYQRQNSITDSADTSGGIYVGAATVSTAFFRVKNVLTGMNSRPPVTADNANTVLHWKFDGNLADSSPNAYLGSMPTPSYAATPHQDATAVAAVYGHPTWTNVISLRAGKPSRLDGSLSYSQADASAAVSCSWSQTAGAWTVTFDNPLSCSPTVSGLVFGTYGFSLTVTDTSAQTNTSTLTVGAVSTDDNGVVVQADPNADILFGPMIAFGKSPWGYMDERQRTMIDLQSSYLSAWTDPVWLHSGTGTVAYPFSGKGMWYGGATGTTLSGAITNSPTATIPVTNASALSLSSLPTWIVIGNLSSGAEIVRICSTTATSGAAILTPCYDGRALTMTPDAKIQGTSIYTTPQAWGSGTVVGELRIQGTGTQFVTDPTTPICPAGAPGPAGTVVYATGTVTVAAGSTTITGSGTSFSGNVYANQLLRISATHGGTPFVYWATITSVTDATHLVVDRPLPAGVDAGPYSYSVLAVRMIALHFAAPNGSDQMLRYGSLGCESETAAFAMPYYDISGANGVAQSGQAYTYEDFGGHQTAFGPNFYGTGLAARAFYLRSGYAPALEVANRLDDKWAKSPEVAGGYAGGNPLLLGGGVVGAIADVVLNPASPLQWKDVRRFIELANIGSSACNDDDTRDTGYQGEWTALGALFDTAQQSTWLTNLSSIYTRDNSCKTQGKTGLAVETNSWAESGYRWTSANGGNTASFTNGSTAGTGSGIQSSMCSAVASGSATVVAASASVSRTSGDSFATGNKIWLYGTKSGAPFSQVTRFTFTSANSITLAGVWGGDNGTATFMIENTDYLTAWSQNKDSASLTQNYACKWNSSTSITLDRPWQSASGTYNGYAYVLSGYGTQPYMLGIKTTMFDHAAQVADGTLAANFRTLAGLAAGWIHDYGVNPVSKGLYYGRVFGACEPPVTPASPSNSYVTPGCNSDGNISGDRVLIGEVSSSLRAYYQAQSGSPAAKTWGDQIYGALWGYTPWDTGGVYDDSYSIGNVGGFNTTNNDFGSYKWPGFFFGMGMAHQWPAVRLGGVQAPVITSRSVSFDLLSVPGATQVRVTVTAPSSATSAFTCTASPCVVTVDDRQGDHWAQVQYRDGSGGVLRTDSPIFLAASEGPAYGHPTAIGGRTTLGGKVIAH